MKPIRTGNKAIQIWTLQNALLHLRSVIPVLASRRKNRISYSKPSNRQKVLPVVNTEAPVLVCPSAVVLPNCWAVVLNWKVIYHREVHLLYSCLLKVYRALYPKKHQTTSMLFSNSHWEKIRVRSI